MQNEMVLIDPSIKVVLFDHDDTLVGTIKAKWAQHKFIARTFYGKQLSDKELRAHWGKPLTVLMKLLYGTDHIDMAMSYNIATRGHFPKILFKNTIKTLNSIRKLGKKVGLVTATTQASLNHDFQTLGIPRELFDFIQTEDETLFHKPDPRVFEPVVKWLAKQDINPQEVLYVGDHLNDMLATQQSGFQFMGVATGLFSVEDFAQHNIKAISKLTDLLGPKGKKTSKKRP
jgi:phosphoglycolate phosphatase